MGANAKLVRDAYAAFGKGDIAAVIAMLDEKVVWSSPRTLPHGGEFSGTAQVGKFFEGIGAAWDSLALAAESVDEAGGNVIGVLRADGKRKDGRSQSYGAVRVFAVTSSKIRSFREYVDVAKPL